MAIKEIKREDIYFFLLAAFLVALPLRVAYGGITSAVLSAFFILDTPNNIKRKIRIVTASKTYIIFLGFFILQLIGLLYTENFTKGNKEIVQLLPLVTLPLTLLTEKISARKLERLLIGFKLFIIVELLFLLILQYYYYNRILNFENDIFSKLKIRSFYFSAFIYFSIIITVFQLKKAKYKAVFRYIEIIILLYFLSLLTARIALIITVIGLASFYLFEVSKVSLWKKIPLILITTVLFSFVAYQVPQIQKKINIMMKTTDFDFDVILTKNQITQTKNSFEYRVLINYCGFQIMKEHTFGVGTGDHQDALIKKYEEIDFIAGKKRQYNAHNQYLSEGIKLGFIGLLCFMFLMGFFTYKGYTNKHLLWYCMLYIGIVCLVESYFDRQHGVMFAAFFITLLSKLEDEKVFLFK